MAPGTFSQIAEEFTANQVTKDEKSALTSVGAFPVGLAVGGAVQTKLGLLSRTAQTPFFFPIVFGTLSALLAFKLHKSRSLQHQTRPFRRR